MPRKTNMILLNYGCIFWRTVPATKNKTRRLGSLYKLPYTWDNRPIRFAVKEISKSIEQAVRLMDSLTNMGMENEMSSEPFLYRFQRRKFFSYVAKLKAPEGCGISSRRHLRYRTIPRKTSYPLTFTKWIEKNISLTAT